MQIQMLDINGGPIPDAWIVDLVPDPGNGEIWEVTLYNIPNVAVQYKLYWNDSATMGFEWDDDDGEVTGFIDWQSAEFNFNIPCEYVGE